MEVMYFFLRPMSPFSMWFLHVDHTLRIPKNCGRRISCREESLHLHWSRFADKVHRVYGFLVSRVPVDPCFVYVYETTRKLFQITFRLRQIGHVIFSGIKYTVFWSVYYLGSLSIRVPVLRSTIFGAAWCAPSKTDARTHWNSLSQFLIVNVVFARFPCLIFLSIKKFDLPTDNAHFHFF